MSIETIMVGDVSVQVIDVGQFDEDAKGYKISADGRVFSNKIGGKYRQIGHRNSAGERQFTISRQLDGGFSQTTIKVNSVLSALCSEFLVPLGAKSTVPGGRWFVALIENGIPKFSSSPVGHKDEASAKTEASRLAREHNGKKFGVFHMVTSCVVSKEIWE